MKVDGNSSGLNGLHLEQSKKEVTKSLNKLASGKEIIDPAIMMIADMMQNQISTYTQGIKNANDAVGYLDIASGVSNSLMDGSIQLSEISVAMNNGALNSDQKSMLSSQSSGIMESMQMSINSATFNGKSVFGESSFHLGSGMVDMNIQRPNLSSIDVANSSTIDDFVKTINSMRSDIGSYTNRIVSAIDANSGAITNITGAKSQMSDTDYAKDISELKQNNLKLDISTIAFAHKNNYLKNKTEALLK
jgi:flagellin